MTVFYFGDFELHAAQRKLMHRGVAIEATPRAIELLAFLIEHRDRIVDRRELHRALWPDVHVTEGALNQLVWELRRVLASGGASHAIRTMRARGYQFVAHVDRLSAPTGSGKVAIAGTATVASCIGRERELGQLRRSLADCRKGRGRMVLLQGEIGMGKTCLAEVILAEAAAVDALASRISCSNRPEAVRSVLDELCAAPRSSKRMVVALIDDLHAATPQMIVQLRVLAPRLAGARILILVAYRPSSLAPWQSHLLSRLQPSECIELKAIHRRDVELLVQQAHGKTISAAFVDDVYDLAGGNPALVREVARSLSELSS